MMKWATAVLMIMVAAGSAFPRTLWRDRNLYSTAGLVAGDVVIIDIRDISSMRFTVDVSNKNYSTVSSNPDMIITGFLPKVAQDKSIKSGDTTDFKESGKLNFSIAGTVTGLQNGKYVLAGNRTYSFNGITTVIRVNGSVDPAILQGRSVDSRRVADFRLEIRELREGVQIQRPPLKEGDTASSALTEDEKQRIIIDYLQKMLGELTR